MTGSGEHTNYGDDWGMVLYCYTHITTYQQITWRCQLWDVDVPDFQTNPWFLWSPFLHEHPFAMVESWSVIGVYVYTLHGYSHSGMNMNICNFGGYDFLHIMTFMTMIYNYIQSSDIASLCMYIYICISIYHTHTYLYLYIYIDILEICHDLMAVGQIPLSLRTAPWWL